MPLSGAFWVTQFRGSQSIDDLEPNFRGNVRRFVNAIESSRSGLPDAHAVPANPHARPGVPNGAGRAPPRLDAAQHPNAHPRIRIRATFRPAQRAYLMHYCWLINRRQIDPAHVPAYQPIGVQRDPVDIQWLHRDRGGNPDIAASRLAALEMVNGFEIA